MLPSESLGPASAAPQTLDPTVVALGGEEIPVKLKTGETIMVKVRILEIEHFSRFIDLQRQERGLAEFVCAQPEGWGATIETDSLLEIVEKADALNFSRALRWIERRAKTLSRLAPVNTKARQAAAS